MKIEIRLKKLLGTLDCHGITQQIANDLKVHRHTISKLYHNQLKNPSLEVLGDLCEWLHENAGVAADQLPGALFGFQPSGLFHALSCEHVRIFLGEYRQTGAENMRWIAVPDAAINTEIVRRISNPHAAAKHVEIETVYVPFRFSAKESSVPEELLEEDLKQARVLFKKFQAHDSTQEKHACILIGSQRINHLLELFVADLFNCRPFSQPPGELPVPFYVIYRPTDVAVPSCFGGKKFPHGMKGANRAGIHIRLPDRKWKLFDWSPDKGRDVGVVVLEYDPGIQKLVMAVFGFSGLATRALGQYLFGNKSPWPPYYKCKKRQIGIYICQIKHTNRGNNQQDDVAEIENVEKIDPTVLAQYFK